MSSTNPGGWWSTLRPATGRNTLVNALLAHCRELSGGRGRGPAGNCSPVGQRTPPGSWWRQADSHPPGPGPPVSRANHDQKYLALVHGRVSPPEAEINAPIGRHPVHRKKRWPFIPSGKPAVTRYRVLEYAGPCSLLEVTLETGRTHQIRVHMQYIGHPLVGDELYGRKGKESPLTGQGFTRGGSPGFLHPRTGRYQEFVAPLPPEMEAAIAYYRKKIKGGILTEIKINDKIYSE